MQYIYLILFLAAMFFLVRYWDKKRKKDLKIKQREKEYMNEILGDSDVTEKYYHDDREVEYRK